MVAHGLDEHVSAMAEELVGRFGHSSREAEAALLRARDADPSRAVRKKARWYPAGAPSTVALKARRDAVTRSFY